MGLPPRSDCSLASAGVQREVALWHSLSQRHHGTGTARNVLWDEACEPLGLRPIPRQRWSICVRDPPPPSREVVGPLVWSRGHAFWPELVVPWARAPGRTLGMCPETVGGPPSSRQCARRGHLCLRLPGRVRSVPSSPQAPGCGPLEPRAARGPPSPFHLSPSPVPPELLLPGDSRPSGSLALGPSAHPRSRGSGAGSSSSSQPLRPLCVDGT